MCPPAQGDTMTHLHRLFARPLFARLFGRRTVHGEWTTDGVIITETAQWMGKTYVLDIYTAPTT
jgi:hypothetical protein